MVGTYGVARTDLHELGERLEGSTLVPVPLFGDDEEGEAPARVSPKVMAKPKAKSNPKVSARAVSRAL